MPSGVVSGELRDVTVSTGTIVTGEGEGVVVRVGDVGVHPRHARLEQRGDVAQSLRGRRIESGKPGVAVGVRDGVAVQVVDRGPSAGDLRGDELVAVQRGKAAVAAGFVRQQIRLADLSTDAAVARAGNRDALEG